MCSLDTHNFMHSLLMCKPCLLRIMFSYIYTAFSIRFQGKYIFAPAKHYDLKDK